MIDAPWWIFAAGSVAFKTAFQITRKKALSKLHAMNFESVRSLLTAIFCLFLIPFIDLNFNKTTLIWIYVVSLIATIGILYTSKGLKHGDLSLLSPLGNFKPAFVAILAVLFLSETLVLKQIIGIIILFVSMYLLESDHHFKDFVAPIKHLIKSKSSRYFLFAIFIFSITAILDRYILVYHTTNVFTYFFFVWIFLAINFNLVHFFMYGGKDTIECFRKTKYLTLLVAFLAFVGNLFAFKAISMEYISLVTPVLMLTSFFVVLFGGQFFHERYRYFRLTISALMLVGVYLIIM